MTKKIIDIKASDEKYREFTSDSRVSNVYRVHYNSDNFGAMSDFGEVHIKNFNKEKDEIVFVDLNGKWKNSQEFKNGLWMKEFNDHILIPFRCDIASRLKNKDNNLIIDGVKKKARFINKIDNLDINMSFEAIEWKEQA
jgi:hypothetical protein